MSNRFHNKLHRQNHHSQRTSKNNTYTDASYDPIASYEAPFQGEFYSDGEIVTHSYLSADQAIYTTDLNVSNNLTVSNNLSVSNDLLVAGNFTVLGSASRVDTLLYLTSAMSIVNNGTGPALIVNQTGDNVVANFQDDGTSALFIDGRTAAAGFVGINTNTPNERLTIVGNVSARGNGIFTQNLNISGDHIVQGKIGVGRAPLNEKIEVSGAVLVAGITTTNQASAGTFDYRTDTGQTRILSWGKDATTNGTFGIWTGTANNTASERVTIDQNGNVGINTSTSLTQRFNVQGDSRFQGNVTITGNLSAAGTASFANTVFTTTSALSVYHVGSGPAAWIGNSGLGDIASFYDLDAGVEVLHVGGSNGDFPNVGVKTSNPNVDFTVNGQVSASKELYVGGTINAQTLNIGSTDTVVTHSTGNILQSRTINSKVWDTSATFLSGDNLTTNNRVVKSNGTNQTLVNSIITDDGTNVGINNISPTATLDVNGSFKTLSANVVTLFAVPVGTTTQRVSAQGAVRYNTTEQTFEGYNGTEWGPIGGGAVIDKNKDTYISAEDAPPGTNNDQLKFFTNGSERMIILSGGEVGVGTSTPNQKLTVQGSISASNTVHISAVEFTGITTTATSITADNLFIQVNIGGVQKYIRLFDIE